jgi:hypothetical protein
MPQACLTLCAASDQCYRPPRPGIPTVIRLPLDLRELSGRYSVSGKDAAA